jgi:hypothetical protein
VLIAWLSQSTIAWLPSTNFPLRSMIARSQPGGWRGTRRSWVLTPRASLSQVDSAGGTLAAATTLRLRDEGGPSLCGQLLIYPGTDYHTPGTPSHEDNAEGYGLTRDTMKWFWDHYLSDPSEASSPMPRRSEPGICLAFRPLS